MCSSDLRVRSLAFALGVGGELLTGVNQQIVDRWLTSSGVEPPHGAAQLVLFVIAASIDLVGMVAVLIGVFVLARRLINRDLVGHPSLLRRRRPVSQANGATISTILPT